MDLSMEVVKAQCNICLGFFDEKELTTVTPSQYLGQEYPDITSFCPDCFRKFLIKAQKIYTDAETVKSDKLKDLVNS